jgi:tetratricopeptide (TPR) repeat protein
VAEAPTRLADLPSDREARSPNPQEFALSGRFLWCSGGNFSSVAVETGVLPARYRGPQRIGRGGMGEIYRATDETLGRAVAVKVLAERFAQDDAVRERFTREALAAARLSGRPNVVTIFDVGEWNDRPYIVMEYLSGGSLEERLRKGRVPAGQALAWLEQASAALDAAHAEGVVHRDVKPGNLLLDRDENVHVADFGVASAAGLDSLTKTGTVLGTAAYLSPEQAQGKRATPASDLYALAVLAWELLTGERPFTGDTAAAEAAAHVHAAIPSISERRRDLPRELDDVFRRALAKNPAERYGSAAELVAELRAALHSAAGRTEIVPPRAPARRVSGPARPAWLVPAIVLLALLGAGLIAAAILAAGGDGEGASAKTVVRTITAEGTTAEVTVSATPPSASLSVAQARALQDESTAELSRGNWERALTLSRRALERLRGNDRTYEAYANYNIGRALAELDRCDEALPYLARRELLLGPHPDVTAAKRKCGA